MGASAQAREVAGTVAKQCSRTGLKLQTREVLDATAGRDVASLRIGRVAAQFLLPGRRAVNECPAVTFVSGGKVFRGVMTSAGCVRMRPSVRRDV